MYKKIALFSALICPFIQCANNSGTWLEFKPSYFFFNISPMKDIYSKGGLEVQSSVSTPVAKYLDLYGSIGYRKAWGHALNSGAKTKLTVVPFDIGLKPIFNFYKQCYYFITIGPRFFYFHQNNNSPYVERLIGGGGIGLFANTGFNIGLANNMLLGVFGEYSYEKKTITPTMTNVYSTGSVQMGGFAFGVSLGYNF